MAAITMSCLAFPCYFAQGKADRARRPASSTQHDLATSGSFTQMGVDLVTLYRATESGDRDAFNELYEQLKGLVAWAIRNAGVVGPDAEDIFQNTWAKFFEYLGRHRDPRALGGWLVTVARNECIARGRLATRVIPIDDFADIEADEVPPDSEALRSLDIEVLDEVMGELNERDRQLVALWAHGASYKEMNQALGIPPGSVGPTMARCRDKIANLMKDRQ